MRAFWVFGSIVLLAVPAVAAPDTSTPPRLKPVVGAVSVTPEPTTSDRIAPVGSLPPRLRAVGGAPITRPPVRDTGAPEVRVTRATGPICRDRAIRGQILAPIPPALPGCGISDPVRVESVAGVTLDPGAIMTCDTAEALKTWVEGSVKPAWGRIGGGVTRLDVAASYDCRPQNNQAGARISDHGQGRALDISAVGLANGARVSVLDGWSDDLAGQALRRMHEGACGPFRTVIGPDGDRFHRDHLHLDTAERRRALCR